jgi:hypothetical protein
LIATPQNQSRRTTWTSIGVCLLLVSISLVLVGRLATPAPASDLSCSQAANLDELIDCVVARMPAASGPDGFAVPDATALDDWRAVNTEMLAGRCEDIALPDRLRPAYVIKTIADAGANHCVLLEVADADGNGVVDRGWGTFIVRSGPARELNIQAPHAVTDRQTESEAIGVYKGVAARSFLMAGTPRGANQTLSSCQIEAYESDAAHNTVMPFHFTTVAIAEYYARTKTDFNVIQFHGMRDTSCSDIDVYMTNGIDTKPLPSDRLAILRAAFVRQNPKLTVRTPGEPPPCNLVGETNVQGRLLNGVDPGKVCTFPLARGVKPSGKFIHIEQKMSVRNASMWVPAISSVWPGPPAAMPASVAPAAPVVPFVTPEPSGSPSVPEPEEEV